MKALVIGSMNCMPTEYAILLKKYCEEVVHYYDAGALDTLSNPKIRWGDKSKNKTHGISVRKIIFRHYLSYLLPRLFHHKMISELNSADLIILSGPSISLARLVSVPGKKVIALSYGSDISLFCNPGWPTMTVPKTCGLKGMVTPHLRLLRSKFVKMQVAGLKSCTHYSYFINGLDPETDDLLDKIFFDAIHPVRLPRYSIGLGILDMNNHTNPFLHHGDLYKILFPVRFSEHELLGNKGWRMLFDSLQKYKIVSKRKFICICFKKGNYYAAQTYAKEIGVDDVIEWQEVVAFDALVQYYRNADVVVEQLGSHWVAQGLFAMALGKPVIGRVSTARQIDFFKESGLLTVENVDSLVLHLLNCESESYRDDVGNQSRTFVPARAEIEQEFAKWGLF